MLFSSFVFIWMFLPVVITGNFILQKAGGNRAANPFLLLASLFFYAWGEPVYVLLMLFSIAVNWICGRLLETSDRRGLVLFVNVSVNLFLLGFFKYADMAVSTVNHLAGTQFHRPHIALPIGISFFTFQALSYVIDVYRGECAAQKSVLKLALYISFFPQLIAGPIVKYRDVADQIDNRTVSAEQTAEGIRRFVYGFGKKILIANTLAACVDQLFGLKPEETSSPLLWIAATLYLLQIYYDFSGYSDMAIGLGSMFGFSFKENFTYPFLSRSMTEYWRHWHISLGTWFREYLYFPLGGSRHGAFRSDINLLLVFLLTGLWHGASWNFVVWGFLHGLALLAERLFLKRVLDRHNILSRVYMYVVEMIIIIVFRMERVPDGIACLKRMLLPWTDPGGVAVAAEYVNPHVLAVFIASVLGMGIIQTSRFGGRLKQLRGSGAENAYLIAVFALSILSLAGGTYNPFIYFRF